MTAAGHVDGVLNAGDGRAALDIGGHCGYGTPKAVLGRSRDDQDEQMATPPMHRSHRSQQQETDEVESGGMHIYDLAYAVSPPRPQGGACYSCYGHEEDAQSLGRNSFSDSF